MSKKKKKPVVVDENIADEVETIEIDQMRYHPTKKNLLKMNPLKKKRLNLIQLKFWK